MICEICNKDESPVVNILVENKYTLVCHPCRFKLKQQEEEQNE